MIDAERVSEALTAAGMDDWAKMLPLRLAELRSRAHGRRDEWQAVLDRLPEVDPTDVRLTSASIAVGNPRSVSATVRQQIDRGLRALHPWRKGPFSIHGVHVDTEWRSDLKWARLSPHIEALEGRVVLDVGAGNNYYGWRMIGAGARLVIGIDPSWLFLAQFQAIRHFLGEGYPLHLLPFGIEVVPSGLSRFDTVFSMGVLYHRRSPIDHLLDLHGALRPGGELVLETLILEGGEDSVLVPRGRYAKMRNVWFIPSARAVTNWLIRSGFEDVRIVDITATGTREQRSTDWMTFESLPDFLDPEDPKRTLEGYPAPIRAILVAKRAS